MPDLIAHPVDLAWVSTGGTGAQNYDEFASDAEVAAVIARHPDSALAVEMPHCVPNARAAGVSFGDALPAAVNRLRELKDNGLFTRADDVVAPYRVRSAAGTTYGVFTMVDTDEISSTPDVPGRVIRNEDVFPAKVRERAALIKTLHHLVSPVLLVQAGGGAELEDRLVEVIESLGDPVVSDVDQLGQTHDVWLLPAGSEREKLLAAAGSDTLIVADGNHRTLAAQQAGVARFLAVLTSPGSLHIRPYNRLVERLGQPPDQFVAALAAAGATVDPWEGELAVPVLPGTVAVYLPNGAAYAVRLPEITNGTVVDRLDHSVVERVIFGEVLGLDPDDPAIRYIGGDYPVDWLTGEVDAGRAEAAILISPVSVDDFMAVNLARLKMPRKSTWFTPKARAGLLVAELPDRPDDGAGNGSDRPPTLPPE